MNIFVDVILRHDRRGRKRPMFIKWNNGILYEIDRVKDVSKAVSDSGMQVVRYDIVIAGRETALYEDKYLGKWYVAEKQTGGA